MNSSNLQISSKQLPIEPSCCSTTEKTFEWQKTIETICRIVIGTFAALYAPLPFLLPLGAGVIGGTVYAITRHYQNKSIFPKGKNKPVCAQGY